MTFQCTCTKSYAIILDLPSRDYELTITYQIDNGGVVRKITFEDNVNSPKNLLHLLKDLGIPHSPR
jgi:hypothetical protein